ncbi:MAG: hypothetical protein ACTSR8_04765 [Promethearchaeota archaeon]
MKKKSNNLNCLKNGYCPFCKKKFIRIHFGKGLCKRCKTEWPFDGDTGFVRFVNFNE